jgi:hypothetical protein
VFADTSHLIPSKPLTVIAECICRKSFGLVKNTKTRFKYARLAGRVVISLLRRIIAGEVTDAKEETPLKYVRRDTFAGQDGDDEFEEDVDTHLEELFILAEELVDEDRDRDEDEEIVGASFDNATQLSEDHEGSNDSGTDDGEGSTTEDNTTYPVLLTTQQCTALHKLWTALLDAKPDDHLLPLFHEVSLSLFTTQREDAEMCRFHLPIESFIILSNLRKDRSIRNPASTGPELSMLQYWAQFTILRDAMISGEPVSM